MPSPKRKASEDSRNNDVDEVDDDDNSVDEANDNDEDEGSESTKIVKTQKLIPLLPVYAPQVSPQVYSRSKVSTVVKNVKADTPIIEDFHHRIIYPKPKQISIKY